MLDIKSLFAHLTNAISTDYIVEEGTPSVTPTPTSAFYRKWNSGKIEIWYKFSGASGITTNVWSAPIYYADYSTWQNIWNGLFINAPISCVVTSNMQHVISIMPRTLNANGIQTMRFISVNSISGGAYEFSIYALGRWK